MFSCTHSWAHLLLLLAFILPLLLFFQELPLKVEAHATKIMKKSTRHKCNSNCNLFRVNFELSVTLTYKSILIGFRG